MFRFFFCVFCFLGAECYGARFLRENSLKKEKVHGYEYGIQKFYSNVVVTNRIEEQCHAENFAKAIQNNLKQSRCQPRDTVVHLTSGDEDFVMIPNNIVVKRCSESGCFGKNSCAASVSRQVRVAVRVMRFGLRESTCAWVSVTEHTKCRCGCMVKPEHCSPLQEYVRNNCSCRCKNHLEKNDCNREGKVWDPNTCSCSCHADWMECSTGTEFVPRMCKCMRVMMNENEDYDKYKYEMITK